MRSRAFLISFGVALALLILIGTYFSQQARRAEQLGSPAQSASAALGTSPFASATPSVAPTPAPSVDASGNPIPTAAPAAPGSAPDLTTDLSGLSKANVVLTTAKGVIKFKLYPKDAPSSVKRILELVQSGFYNGLIFHRVEKDPPFLIQGGDPTGEGKNGGSGQKLKAEFSDRRHLEGTVGLARGRDPDSADSQFYITLAPQPSLDRNYTVIGQVTEGMDVARKIDRGDKILSMRVE